MIDRTRILSVMLALLFLSTAFSTASAQERESSIRGRVHSSTGANAAWIIVRLLTSSTEPVTLLTVTNNAGEFLFDGLKETDYLIVVAAPGYQTATEKINLKGRASSVNTDGVRTVEITLLPARSAAPESTSQNAFMQNVPKAALDTFERAMRLGKAGRKQVANTMLQEAIKIYPDYFDAHLALSNEMMKAGRIAEAITEFEEASRINPRDDRVYQTFGALLLKQGKYEVAAAVFAEASRLNPSEALHPLMRAEALIDYASAIDPASSESAGVVVRNDALNEAERNLNLASDKSNNRLAATVHFQRARLYQRRGERERAAAELEQYLLANPAIKNADEIRDVIRELRTPATEIAPAQAQPPPPQ
jgi:Tfp pilus assembly protein PilF